jgi:hypothetical protein
MTLRGGVFFGRHSGTSLWVTIFIVVNSLPSDELHVVVFPTVVQTEPACAAFHIASCCAAVGTAEW